MQKEIKEKGARLLVVTLSNGIQVHPDPKIRAQFMQSLGVHDLSYPDRRIRELCERDGIPVVNLAEPLLAYAEKQGGYLHGFEGALGYGHWNQTGHQLAGELIFQRILELKLVPSTTTSIENSFPAKH